MYVLMYKHRLLHVCDTHLALQFLYTCSLHQEHRDPMMPAKPAWVQALCPRPRQKPQDPPAWALVCPWREVEELSSLLLDMTPSDMFAFVPAAARIGANRPVALLLIAVAKHPEFIAALSEAISATSTLPENSLMMFGTIRSALVGLGCTEAGSTAVISRYMPDLTTLMQRLGMLEADDALSGVLLGGRRWTLADVVPASLRACCDTASSHYFPDVTTASDVIAYLQAWDVFLSRLPTDLQLSGENNPADPMYVVDKLMVWLRSAFPDKYAARLWPVGVCLTFTPSVAKAFVKTRTACELF